MIVFIILSFTSVGFQEISCSIYPDIESNIEYVEGLAEKLDNGTSIEEIRVEFQKRKFEGKQKLFNSFGTHAFFE